MLRFLESGSEFQPMVDYAKVSFFDADSTEQDNHFGMRGVFVQQWFFFLMAHLLSLGHSTRDSFSFLLVVELVCISL